MTANGLIQITFFLLLLLASVKTGNLASRTPLSLVRLSGVVIMLGALTFLPALALGPIAEHLVMVGQ